MKNKEIFYVSNILSASRFVLLIIVVFFLTSNSDSRYLYASLFIVIMWLTDILDGYFARSRNEISELGKVIDPVADKVSIITISLVMVMTGIIPLWFFLVIMSRDILILSGGLAVKKKTGKVLQSNITGKLTVFVIGFTLMNMLIITHFLSQNTNNFFLYHIEKLELYWKFLILISMMMIVISIVSYFRIFLKSVIK